LSLTGRFGKITTMSTPPKRDSKAAAKRRAEARRRNRDIGRHLFAYGVIAILVISTVSTVLIPSAGAPTLDVPTVVPATPTQASQGLEQLLTQAKTAEDKGDWVTAAGLYQAYLASQASPSADVQLKLAKALINSTPPDYVKASTALQQAISLAGQGSAIATEAQQLLADNAPKIATAQGMPTATATVGIAITATVTLSTTSVPLTSVTAAPTGIGPVPIVPTSTTTSAPGTPGASPTR
jgi:hypothetical protein